MITPLPIGKNKKVIGMVKDELGGKIMTGFVVLTEKIYARRRTDKVEDKCYKGNKKCVVTESHTFEGESIYREKMLFENEKHELNTGNKHKIALNRDNDKRHVEANGITVLTRGYLAETAMI